MASNWLQSHFRIAEKEITFFITELAYLFEKELLDFLQLGKGENKKYSTWFSSMQAQLIEEELPYAF